METRCWSMKTHGIGYWGGSKLNLSSTIPAWLETTEEKCYVITTHKRKTKGVVFEKMEELNYQVICADENMCCLEDLDRTLDKNNVRVAMIDVDHVIFRELMEKITVWITACRDGLFYYLSQIPRIADKSFLIISFDNDKNMINEAYELYKDTCITVVQGTAHSVCASMRYDADTESIYLKAGKECELIFPPEAFCLKQYMRPEAFRFTGRAQLRFTESHKELQFFVEAKAIDVNVWHSFLSQKAILEGTKMGLSIAKILETPFSELLDKENAIFTVSRLHRTLFNKTIGKDACLYGFNTALHNAKACDFVRTLFSNPEEIVKRGLDITSESFKSKLQRHNALLKVIDDEECNKIVEQFLNVLYSIENN